MRQLVVDVTKVIQAYLLTLTLLRIAKTVTINGVSLYPVIFTIR